MCLYPRIIKNPKYKANKKNGGIIPAVNDHRTMAIPIGCKHCMECRAKKKREWHVRLLEEIKHNTNGKFVTLTFNTESLIKLKHEVYDDGNIDLTGYELDNAIAIKAIDRFCERWRKKYKKYPKRWFVTELGQNNTEHLHIHGIIWTNEHIDEIIDKWQYGFVHKGKPIWERGKIIGYKNYVNDESIGYMIKYVSKIDLKHQKYEPIILASNGIGKSYNSNENKFNDENTKEYYRTNTGYKLPLPIYYRNKIYTEEEREKLWINRLNKQIRYVDGIEIDISKNDTKYYNTLKTAQAKNKELKFGGWKTKQQEWGRLQYEQERRILIQNMRWNKNATETKKLQK